MARVEMLTLGLLLTVAAISSGAPVTEEKGAQQLIEVINSADPAQNDLIDSETTTVHLEEGEVTKVTEASSVLEETVPEVTSEAPKVISDSGNSTTTETSVKKETVAQNKDVNDKLMISDEEPLPMVEEDIAENAFSETEPQNEKVEDEDFVRVIGENENGNLFYYEFLPTDEPEEQQSPIVEQVVYDYPPDDIVPEAVFRPDQFPDDMPSDTEEQIPAEDIYENEEPLQDPEIESDFPNTPSEEPLVLEVVEVADNTDDQVINDPILDEEMPDIDAPLSEIDEQPTEIDPVTDIESTQSLTEDSVNTELAVPEANIENETGISGVSDPETSSVDLLETPIEDPSSPFYVDDVAPIEGMSDYPEDIYAPNDYPYENDFDNTVVNPFFGSFDGPLPFNDRIVAGMDETYHPEPVMGMIPPENTFVPESLVMNSDIPQPIAEFSSFNGEKEPMASVPLSLDGDIMPTMIPEPTFTGIPDMEPTEMTSDIIPDDVSSDADIPGETPAEITIKLDLVNQQAFVNGEAFQVSEPTNLLQFIQDLIISATTSPVAQVPSYEPVVYHHPEPDMPSGYDSSPYMDEPNYMPPQEQEPDFGYEPYPYDESYGRDPWFYNPFWSMQRRFLTKRFNRMRSMLGQGFDNMGRTPFYQRFRDSFYW